MILSQEQLNESARSMALGTARRVLVDRYAKLLDGSPDIGYTGQELRDMISRELASCQKGNARYAATKYDDIYAEENALMENAFGDEALIARNLLVNTMKMHIELLQERIGELRKALEDYDFAVTLPPEKKQFEELLLKFEAELEEKIFKLAQLTGALEYQPTNLRELKS